MQMIGKKFEKQEQENLERYVNKRLGDARAKVNPSFREQPFLYVQGQPQPQTQPVQQQQQPQRMPQGVGTVPPSLRKPSVIPPINDEWLWEDSNSAQQGSGY
jgi:hypothetical protein